jgi:hypothetical protein
MLDRCRFWLPDTGKTCSRLPIHRWISGACPFASREYWDRTSGLPVNAPAADRICDRHYRPECCTKPPSWSTSDSLYCLAPTLAHNMPIRSHDKRTEPRTAEQWIKYVVIAILASSSPGGCCGSTFHRPSARRVGCKHEH